MCRWEGDKLGSLLGCWELRREFPETKNGIVGHIRAWETHGKKTSGGERRQNRKPSFNIGGEGQGGSKECFT